jgi:hypothetical protein
MARGRGLGEPEVRAIVVVVGNVVPQQKRHGVDACAYLRAAVSGCRPWHRAAAVGHAQGPLPPSVTATESNAIDTTPPDA